MHAAPGDVLDRDEAECDSSSALDAATHVAGSAVVVTGLQTKPDYNGRWAIVQSFDPSTGRYAVQISGVHKVISLKPSNLTTDADVLVSTDVDISPFVLDRDAHSAKDRSIAMASWDTAFRRVGFARITGHQVPLTLASELRAAASEFFSMPGSKKMQYHHPATANGCSPGSYAPLWAGRASGAHDDPLEGYTFHRPRRGWEHVADPALGHPPGLAAVAQRYASVLESVMHALHRLSAESLSLPGDYFDSPAGSAPTSLLVISHYPPLTGPELAFRPPSKPRYRAHSDYTGFTILLQDEADHGGGAESGPSSAEGCGGLEVDIDGRWTPVVPRPGSFVVNIGDLFELWTNNRWRSTPHRVASPAVGTAAASRSRLTAMLFTGPALETVIQPAPTCGPTKYPTLSARDHLAAMALTKSKEKNYAAASRQDGESTEAGSQRDTCMADAPAEKPVKPMSKQEAAGLALTIASGEGHVECTQMLLGMDLTLEVMHVALQNAEHKGQERCAELVREAIDKRAGAMGVLPTTLQGRPPFAPVDE